MKIKQGKKVIILLNFGLLLLAQEVKAVGMSDLEVYNSEINQAYALEVTSNSTISEGEEVLTLAEAYKISLEALDQDFKMGEGEALYADIEAKANKLALYKGDKKLTDNLTRNDMANIAFNMMKGKEEESKVKFEDKVDGKIGFLVNQGMIKGYEENGKTYFRGEKLASKAEFVAMTFLFVGLVGDEDEKNKRNIEYKKDLQINDYRDFEDLTLNENDFKFNEKINGMNDVVENLLYSAVNDRNSYRVNYNNIKNKDNYHLMFFEAAQILNDKYPEYFSYYSRLNAEVVENSEGSQYVVTLLPTEGKRKDGLNVNVRRDKGFEYLDKGFNNLVIQEKISPNKSDEENAKEIYIWVLENISYKDDENSKLLPADYDTFDVYGVASRNEGVCQAYVGSLNYMLRKAGIEASGVAGKMSGNNVNHVWTLAYIDGKEVYIDPTLGDGPMLEEYFDMSDELYSSKYKEKTYKNFQ